MSPPEQKYRNQIPIMAHQSSDDPTPKCLPCPPRATVRYDEDKRCDQVEDGRMSDVRCHSLVDFISFLDVVEMRVHSAAEIPSLPPPHVRSLMIDALSRLTWIWKKVDPVLKMSSEMSSSL